MLRFLIVYFPAWKFLTLHFFYTDSFVLFSERYFDYDRIIKELQCHQINSYDVPVYSCKFAPTKRDNVLSITYENGSVCIENIEVKNSKTYVKTHDNSVYDLAWVPGEKQFVTVSGDNTARLWTCAESDVKMISEFKGHSQSVRCVYFKPYDSGKFYMPCSYKSEV